MEQQTRESEKQTNRPKQGRGRTILVALILTMLVLAIGFAGLSLRSLLGYERAISLLKDAKYTEAAEAFESMGEYRDAASWLLYSRAAEAGERGEYLTAAGNLRTISGFSDSTLLSVYYEARAYEEAELYEKAQPLYESISLYRDAGARYAALPGKILERDYQAACALQEQGSWQAAIRAFQALNGYKDSEERIAAIRTAMSDQEKANAYAEAEALENDGRLEKARNAFLELGNYRDSAERAEQIRIRICTEAYEAADAAEKRGDVISAYSGFTGLGDFSDSAERAAGLENEYRYQTALSRAMNGLYQEACTAFEALGDYKDSAAKAETLRISRSAPVKTIGTGLASYQLGEMYGLINLNSNRVTVACFDSIEKFNSLGLAGIGKNGRYGFIDDSGTEVIPAIYSYKGEFNDDGLCLVCSSDDWRYGYIDRNGREVIPCDYQALSAFRNGICAGRTGGYLGLLNVKGEALTTFSYLQMGSLSAKSGDLTVPAFDAEGLMRVADASGRYTLMNRQYQLLGDFEWDEILPFSEGLARVRSGKGYGFIDRDAKIVIAPVWPYAESFSEGLCAVRAGDGRYGFIDASGNPAIAAVYDTVSDFLDGYAVVSMKGVGWYMIDREGRNTRFAVAAYEKAVAALDSGDFDAAAQEFAALGEYDDAHQQMLEAYYRKVLALRERGDLEEAGRLAEQLSAYAQYRDSEALSRAIQADQLFAAGDTAAAWQLYAQVEEPLRRHGEDYARMYADAEKLLEAGSWDAAIAAFRALGGYGGSEAGIVQAYDGKYQTEYAAALALMEAGSYDEAIAAFGALGQYSRAQEMAQECAYRKALAAEENGDRTAASSGMIALMEEGENFLRQLDSQMTIREQVQAIIAHPCYSDAGAQFCRITAETFTDDGRYDMAWEIFDCLDEKYHSRDGEFAEKYQAAADQLAAGAFDEAEAGFLALGAYQDSAAQVAACQEGRRNAAYEAAKAQLDSGEYDAAAEGFAALGDYRDSAAQIQECAYRKALDLEKNGKRSEAQQILRTLEGYGDASSQLTRMSADALFEQGRLAEAWELYAQLDPAYHTHEDDYRQRYEAAEAQLQEKQFEAAEAAFLALGGYRDSAKRAEETAEASRADTYSRAQALQNEGAYDEAYDLYASLNGYADSQSKLLEVAQQKADHLFGEGRFAEAAEVYRILGSEKAKEADYQEALRLKSEGAYEAASTLWLSVPDYRDSRDQNLLMADELADRGEYGTALAVYGGDPEYQDVKERVYQIGLAAQQREDYATAVSAWTLLGAYKDSGMNLTMDTYAWADQLFAAGRYDEAAEVFRSMGEFSDTAERARQSAYQAALAALEAGNYQDAETRFLALEKYEDSQNMVLEVRYQAAEARLQAGEYEAALEAFTGLKTYRDSEEYTRMARYAIADQAYQAGEYQAALQEFHEILGYRDAEARWRQARDSYYGELLAAGRYDEAIEGFETLAAEGYVSAVQEASQSHYLKAKSLDGTQQTEAAYHEYVLAGQYEDAPLQARAHAYLLGAALKAGENYPEAIDWFEIAGDYEDAQAQLYQIGYYYFRVQDWQNAIHAFRTLAGYSDVSENLCRIGQYYEMQQDNLNACLAYGYAGPDSEGAVKAEQLKAELTEQADQLIAQGKTADAVAIYKVLVNLDATLYSKLLAADYVQFLAQKGNLLRIGKTDWKYLAQDNGTLIFVSSGVLATKAYNPASYASDKQSANAWVESAKKSLFNDEERKFVGSLWIMSEAEVKKYMPTDSDRKTGGSGKIWTSTKRSGSSTYLTYDAQKGSMGNSYYQWTDDQAGVRPGLKLKYSTELYQLMQDHPDRFRLFDSSRKELVYDSEYLRAYAAAVEADKLKRYRRAMALLERGDYDEASAMFSELEDYQESARMILECAYQKAMALAEAGEDEQAIAAFTALDGYSDSAAQIEAARERLRAKRYAQAEALEAEEQYAAAYEIFADADMTGFSDSSARAQTVKEKAEEQKRQMDYAEAEKLYDAGKLDEALALYEALAGYEDSDARAETVQADIRARDYLIAVEAMKQKQYGEAGRIFAKLGDYEDSAAYLAEIETQYQEALALALAGKLSDAYQAFNALGDYRDSTQKAEIVGNLSRAGKMKKMAEGVVIYEFHSLWGIANLNTNVITPVKYTGITFDTASSYAKYGLAKVAISGGKYTGYNDDGIHADDTYGYIDMNGKEVVPCQYLFVTDFDGTGRCTVAKSKKESAYSGYYTRVLFGIMDHTGKQITAAQWRTMGESANKQWTDRYSVDRWRKSFFTVSQPKFVSGRMKVQNAEGLWGFISEEGKVLGQVRWTGIGSFADGLAMVSESIDTGTSYSHKWVTRYGFINEQGQTIGQVRWEEVKNFSQGLAAVKENGRWGFIDRTNTLVIPCRYAEVNAFKPDGTCDVRNPDGTWIVIDKEGNNAFF